MDDQLCYSAGPLPEGQPATVCSVDARLMEYIQHNSEPSENLHLSEVRYTYEHVFTFIAGYICSAAASGVASISPHLE